jgi:hypothetical protein
MQKPMTLPVTHAPADDAQLGMAEMTNAFAKDYVS